MKEFNSGIIGDVSVKDLLKAGYGVVSIDARGHGDSGGRAFLHHPAQGVNDYRAVLDWIYDNLSWVQKEGPRSDRDIVAGAAGGSYGGGFQLLTAAFDDRLDAIAPVVTWNSLVQSLAPNGVPKSAWLALLYAAGKAFVDVDPRIDQWFAEIMATNRPPAGAVEALTAASPATWMEEIDIPTFLIQGMPDTLFPLNEALSNYLGIRNNGAPVWLLGVNTGHVLPGLQPTGVSAPVRTEDSDCGNTTKIVRDFYDGYLKGDRQALRRIQAFPHVALPTEQGGCVTGSDWPLRNHRVPIEVPAMAVPQGGGSYLWPLITADEKMTIAGIPSIKGTVPVQLDEIFFFSLVVQRDDGFHIVHDQVTPVRTQLAGLRGRLFVELAGVATTLQPGEQLFLRVDGMNEQFALNSNRRGGAGIIQDVTISIPVIRD
jgi:pimeloyl-ACP methyl ester carboxylesterase